MLNIPFRKVLLPGIISVILFPVAARAEVPIASVAGAVPESAIHSDSIRIAAMQDVIIDNRSASASLIATLPVVSSRMPSVQEKVTLALPDPPTKVASMQINPVQSRTDSQDDILAQLDAELAGAQSQVANARQRVSAGQKQLQSLSNTMQSVMREAGPDAEGLHPFVRVASRYVGTPYVWGGESRYGFDCSGLIVRVMRDLGYKTLPHSAAEQFNYGSPVAKSLLKPGDLVFFANTYKPGISHVGIYIGRNRFIQAASTQKGTIVSSLSEPYYAQHYAGARRLAPVK